MTTKRDTRLVNKKVLDDPKGILEAGSSEEYDIISEWFREELVETIQKQDEKLFLLEQKLQKQDDLQLLFNAVDTACWCLAVKNNTKKGQACKVDWKSSLVELAKAWEAYQLKNSDNLVEWS